MNIQSISVVVPTQGCVNNCKFCVSKMHKEDLNCKMVSNKDLKKRIKFAVNNGVNTCIITGTGEPLQNTDFLWNLVTIFREMDHPFPNVELQTSGVLFTGDNIQLLQKLGVNTISLSVSDIFNDHTNMEIEGVSSKLHFILEALCIVIKEENFNLRLSLNMTKSYNDITPIDIFDRCKELGANQITFRELYHSKDESEQTKWVRENKCSVHTIERIKDLISLGNPLYKLPFGAIVYSFDGMSMVLDNDCMSKENNESLKYVILRENGKLYCQWDDEGSLIF